MCLAVPGLIKSRDGSMATVDFGGIEHQIALDLLPDAQPGEYILAHAGFAIQTMEEKEALELYELFRELDDAIEEEDRKNDQQ
jgi:hydrogenase expression/formation protein HypC